MKKRIFGIFIVLLALSMAAQEQQDTSGGGDNQGQSRRGRGNRGGGGPGGGNGGPGGGGFNREAMQKVDEQIKEKLPEEYKELEKLSQSDPRAAYTKRRELAEKAGIEMPSFGRGNRGGNRPDRGNSEEKALEEWQKAEAAIKEKFPKEYEEIDKLRQTDTAAALVKLRELAEKAEIKLPEGEPPGRTVSPRAVAKLAVDRAHQILRERYPDEYAEYEKLREDDPDAAREKFREMFKKSGLTSEELKRQVSSRRVQTQVIQVETPANQTQQQQQQQQGRGGNRGGGGGGWGGGPGGGGGWGGQ